MMLECKICGADYSDKHPKHAGGHYKVCGDCESKKDVKKTLGFTVSTGKSSYWMETMENPTKTQASRIRTQSRCGPSHCHTSLGLNSSGATTAKANLDSVITNLYNLEGSKAEENGEEEIVPLEEKREDK